MFTLKKSLGQHFLRDESVARRVVEALRVPPVKTRTGERPFTQLLEVGPGGGALTKYLLEMPGIELRAVEADAEKVEYLERTWPALKGKILHGSILGMDMPFEGPFTVVGNFPYNISSQILFRMLEWRESLEAMVGMFQKEVALRVAAHEGSKTYGVISVLVQAWFAVEYLFEVSEQCFNPPPKVKSAVIRLRPRATVLPMRSEKDLFTLVKTAFGQRRKTLRNAVKGLFDPEMLRDPLFDRRAEQLSVEELVGLTFRMR